LAKVIFNLPDKEHLELKKKALSLGLTSSGYIAKLLKTPCASNPARTAKQYLWRSANLFRSWRKLWVERKNADRQATEKLTQILLKEYDQGGVNEAK